MEEAYPGCHIENNPSWSPVVVAIEAADGEGHRQALEIRVGPVFYGNRQDSNPGVWISYQGEYLSSPETGPVLLTPEVWHQLTREVGRRLKTRTGTTRWRSLIRKFKVFTG